ncbi:glutathione S-transferase [Piscinibacter sp.]|uniref:glutathione S-transferase family protein n=1 Tax=Piscinibacter sp. TaxID=1903157 RepID=UPI002BC18551|nr:glutathione S-transferase [Albitalea sp.]HUG25990.1 glutathione S-transferase [Albitalea sp.]
MITLCGFSVSNYYNKVKMVLLEKGVPFAEEHVKTGRRDEAVLAASPLAKIPFIRTEHGTMCESQAIVDYIEAAYPNPPLLPADPWQAGKVRELTTFIDLHLELVVRELYPKAFFGGDISEGNAARVRKLLDRNLAGFKRLAAFSPYVAGETFTQADCAAFVSLPLVSLTTKIVYGDDLMAAAGIPWKPYAQLIGERPSAQRIVADRRAEQQRPAVKPN